MDEELRQGIIDAGIVGTPIAKLTHPLFVRDRTTKMRCCGSPRPESSLSLCRNICAMLKIKGLFSRRFREFLLSRRSWDKVKTLMRLLRSGL